MVWIAKRSKKHVWKNQLLAELGSTRHDHAMFDMAMKPLDNDDNDDNQHTPGLSEFGDGVVIQLHILEQTQRKWKKSRFVRLFQGLRSPWLLFSAGGWKRNHWWLIGSGHLDLPEVSISRCLCFLFVTRSGGICCNALQWLPPTAMQEHHEAGHRSATTGELRERVRRWHQRMVDTETHVTHPSWWFSFLFVTSAEWQELSILCLHWSNVPVSIWFFGSACLTPVWHLCDSCTWATFSSAVSDKCVVRSC